MKSDKLEDTYLWEYYQAIRSGEIIAGHELILELEQLIDDYNNPDYYFDRSKGLFKMSFMENCVRLTKSPFYGKPMKLMLWQKAFVETVYSWKMTEDGTDRFRRILLEIARKNGKSEMCSGIVLTELITGNDGSDIVCSSNDDNQANILYEATNAMRLMIDPQQKDTWKTQQYLRCNINGSKVFKLSDRTKNKEGRNIDEAVVDEVHEMKDNVIVKSIEQSQSLKPNPKLFLITTEGFVNDGFLDEELKRARAILNGEDDSISSRRYLPWLYTQDSEQEVWKDETSWFKSNPSLGVVKRWDYLREQVDLARKSKADRMFTLSKDFNIKVSNSEAWLTSDQLSYSKEFDIEDFRGAVCLGGVDLAETTDLCSAKALLMRYDDKTKYIKSMYWIPESKLERSPDTEAGAKYSEWAKAGLIRIVEGNEIDVSLIADWYFELYKDFGIKTYKVGYDQRFANEFIKRMDEYSFETEMVYQNRYVLSSPMRLVEADIQDELINFNNNEIDRWCLENTAVQVWDTGHIMPIKIKGQSSKRIDGTLSLVMSYEMLRRHRTEFNNTLL